MNIIELTILAAICVGVLTTAIVAMFMAPRGWRVVVVVSVLVVGFGWIALEANIGSIVLSGKCQPAVIHRTVSVTKFLERTDDDGYCYACSLSTLRAGYDSIEFLVNDPPTLTDRKFDAEAPGYYRFQFSAPESPNCLRRYRPIMVDGTARCLAVEKIVEPASEYESVRSRSTKRTWFGELRKRDEIVRRIADGEILAHHVHYQFISETYLGKLLSGPVEPGSFGGAYCRTSFGGPTVVLQPLERN